MILALTRRHLRLYFRDKTSVFFSLLSVFIIIGLYALFLGAMVSEGGPEGLRTMMDQWIMAGVLAVSGFTTTLGAYGILVDDRTKKIERDFVVSPLSPHVRILAYLLGSVIIGVIMSLVTFVFAQFYILINGGPLFDLWTIIRVLAVIIVNVITASAIVFFFVQFIGTASTFSTVSTVIGTLIGFLMGIYVRIGDLPLVVQTVIYCFPPSHAGALLRAVMMEQSIATVFAGAEQSLIDTTLQKLGVYFYINDVALPSYVHYLVLVVTGVIFFFASLLVLRYRKQK